MRRETLSRIAAVTIIAVAFAFVWGASLGWFVSTVLKPNYVSRYEELEVAPDGTPLIATNSPLDWRKTEYRSLDGKLLEGKLVNQVQPARFYPLPAPPGLWNETLPWNQRIHSFFYSDNPPSRWYFIINEQAPGVGYFVAYDSLTRLPIGYVGRLGFRSIVPDATDCFQIGKAYGAYRNYAPVVSSAPNGLGTYPMSNVNGFYLGSGIPSWLLFVKDGDTVKEIDMRTGDMRLFFELPDLLVLSSLSEASAGSRDALADETTAKDESELMSSAAVLHGYAGYKQQIKLAFRSASQIAVVDPISGTSQQFELPERIRERGLMAYSIGNSQLLLHVDGGWGRAARTTELIWIDTNGTELRQEPLELAGYSPERPRERAWIASIMAPIPLGWLIGGAGYAPAAYVQINLAPDYAAALRQVMIEIWPAMLLVLFIGAVCALIALHWHGQYYRPNPWAWALTVFLLGPAGLLAYWLHWRRPLRERCAACEALAPRDREACAACGTEFAPPALVGTEVFA